MIPVSEQRARDALVFDPLPAAEWLRATDKELVISVRYGEQLSRLIRSLPAARWDAAERVWRLPFSSAAAIRESFDRIGILAADARDLADRETERRSTEKAERDVQRTREVAERELRRAEMRPRALDPKHLSPTAGPKLALTLEAIGDDHARNSLLGTPPRQSVAQVVGLAANGRWAKCYLSGMRSYRDSNSIGSRGIMVTYLLDPGLIYAVAEPRTWRRTDHWFGRVAAGRIDRMTEDEVRECLSK